MRIIAESVSLGGAWKCIIGAWILWIVQAMALHADWIPVHDGVRNFDAGARVQVAGLFDEQNPRWLAVDSSVYGWTAEQHWVKLFALSRQEVVVDMVACDDAMAWVLSEKKLYLWDGSAKQKRALFSAGAEELCRTLWWRVSEPQRLYVGTSRGLYCSADKGEHWEKVWNGDVYSVVQWDALMAVLTPQAVWRSLDQGRTWAVWWEIKSLKEQSLDDENTADLGREVVVAEDENMVDMPMGRRLRILPEAGLVAAIGDGRCELHSLVGDTAISLENKDARVVLKHITDIYWHNGYWCATTHGVFYKKRLDAEWRHRAEGLDNVTVQSFWCGAATPWVASAKAVYRWVDQGGDKEVDFQMLKEAFAQEPTVQQVQNMAAHYAEVTKDKITRWREQARKKALWPKVSVNVSGKRDDTYEIYTSQNTNYIVNGPEDRGSSWSAGMSWDLGDLVYQSEQTSIDVRSRLMVQLRESILDEVTRVYYERRRLQMEHMLKPMAGEQSIWRQLRIEELTAGLDAYTNGWFSQQLVKPI